MKITTKTTKDTLVTALGDNALAIKKADKGLFERMTYADKMWKQDKAKVTRKDLVDMVKEAITLLGDAFKEPELVPVGAENSVKKLAKGVSKKQETKPEAKEETPEEAPEEEPEVKEAKVVEKKTANKSKGAKKTAPKKDGVTVLEETEESKKAVQLAKVFPQSITAGDTSYNLADDIKTMDDLYNALNNDEEIVFAYYWSKRHLKQYDYFNNYLGQPKSFDNDLDICTAIYVSDEKRVAYQVSMYTEAIYTILPTDFNNEDGVRYAGGIEFQIYRAVQ